EVEGVGLVSQLDTYIDTKNAYKDRVSNLPRLEQKQGELERRLEVAKSTYTSLLGRLQEAQVAENQNVGNARVISPAEPPKGPIPSKEKLILLAGGVAGLLSGIAAAFLLDLIDSSVKNVKEAKEIFGYTLLGIIPQYAKSRKARKFLKEEEEKIPPIYVKDRPHSPISAAYQMLQANLKFLSSDKQLKAIVVTSSIPQEGKSEVSANLAVAIAQVGRRVLLVDADMRDPTQHRIWGLTNAMGLSNVLVGEAEPKAAIENVMPNLDILTAGVIPPNPVALLDSKRMAFLIESFLEDYDSIVFDTPPLVGVADAPILGKMADGILMVVRPKVLNVAGAKAAKDFLIQSGQNVLGLVANGVIIKNEPDSYFYYAKEQYGAQAYAKQKQEELGLHSLSQLPRNKSKK
ncbi:MAG: polysaccharide biosynthesis tyrosine autokinase, partial [Spirulinaceae cyanobacterium]